MIVYREATHDDIEPIAQLHTRSWQRAYRGILRDDFLGDQLIHNRRDLWHERLTRPPLSQHVLVAAINAEVMGFACVSGDEDPRWGSMLDNLHVRADANGQGIGTQLIGHAARWSRDSYPKRGFFLWVFEKNLPARRFYESLGARHSESITIEPPGGGQAIECRYTWSDIDALIRKTEL